MPPVSLAADTALAVLLGERTHAEERVTDSLGREATCAVVDDALLAHRPARTTIVRFAAVAFLRCSAQGVVLFVGAGAVHSFTSTSAEDGTLAAALLLHAPAWMPPRHRAGVEVRLPGRLTLPDGRLASGTFRVYGATAEFHTSGGVTHRFGRTPIAAPSAHPSGLRLLLRHGEAGSAAVVELEVPRRAAPLWQEALTARLAARTPAPWM